MPVVHCDFLSIGHRAHRASKLVGQSVFTMSGPSTVWQPRDPVTIRGGGYCWREASIFDKTMEDSACNLLKTHREKHA